MAKAPEIVTYLVELAQQVGGLGYPSNLLVSNVSLVVTALPLHVRRNVNCVRKDIPRCIMLRNVLRVL